jgi:hypothetical protein
MGCATSAVNQQFDAATNSLKMARFVWEQCVADPTCKGDEMLKKKAELDYAEMDYDRALEARREQRQAIAHALDQSNADMQHSLDQMQANQRAIELQNAIAAPIYAAPPPPAPVFAPMYQPPLYGGINGNPFIPGY